MTAAAITMRLRLTSDLAEPLTAATRLEGKVDMTAPAITLRLKESAALLELGRALAASRAPTSEK
jgi:hypothetical protein